MTETKDTLTAHENEVLALTWQCFETEPKVSSRHGRMCTSHSNKHQVNMDKLISLTSAKYIAPLSKPDP